MKNFLKWLVFSSENPKEVALTIEGIIVIAIWGIIQLLIEAGVHWFDGKVIHIIVLFIALYGAVLAIAGLIRKVSNTLGSKEIVMFKAKKKRK